MAIEANFSQDRLIKLEKDTKPKEINNEIQSFIYRNPKKPELENQKIQVSAQKEKIAEEKTSYFLQTHQRLCFMTLNENIASFRETEVDILKI